MYSRRPDAPFSQGDIFPEFPSIYLPDKVPVLISEEPDDHGKYVFENDVAGPWTDPQGSRISRKVVASALKERIIIMSQTCDLQRRDLLRNDIQLRAGLRSFVLYCPLKAVSELQAGPKQLEDVRRNAYVYLHWLPQYTRGEIDIPESVVCFPLVSCILKARDPNQTFDLSGRIGSLDSPYREHLATRFAYFMSRVAEPLRYPEGSTHEAGSRVFEKGEYSCEQCALGNQALDANARFPAPHCPDARWRFDRSLR